MSRGRAGSRDRSGDDVPRDGVDHDRAHGGVDRPRAGDPSQSRPRDGDPSQGPPRDGGDAPRSRRPSASAASWRPCSICRGWTTVSS
ncbi:hypothetical protein ACFV08_17615, partial [Streptomyces fradiae]